MLNRWSTRGFRLIVAIFATIALAVTAGATGAFGAVGRLLADPGHPHTAALPTTQRLAVTTPKPPVPPPPWSSQLPPNTVYPIWTDQNKCFFRGASIPCKNASGYGYFNPLDNCYWVAENPQPKAGAPIWAGLSVSDGNIYDVRCVNADLTLQPVRAQFSSQLPPGTLGKTVADVKGGVIAAAASVTVTGILAPDMGIQPQSSSTAAGAQAADQSSSTAGLVGLPTWYWSTANLLTVGPVTLSVALPPPLATVQAQLLGQRLEWDTGDNGNVVVCQKVGSPYGSGMASTQPTCGYTYTKPGTYAVSARSVWFLAVSVPLAGVTGTVLVVRSAIPRFIKIDELQVVTQ